ncbi:N-acyl amino acid synthase FeeM domain-containing protein [Novosphingobium chloroacetimidivorans]|uniref:N-acyl amino acid synthase FeeM domain-containing protein n=1 Tax=Novosphingobium chloroacetimidivorans TaxID=1428314 RepID=UPI001C87E8D4|nr:acetyltransferase [Novosphingobium chloroacetimidivorans]
MSVARTECDRLAAESLLNRRYEWRGYGSHHKIGGSAYQTTFLARMGPSLAGTITLGVDTPEGLAADALFKAEIDEYRRVRGSRVCELTRFAFEKCDRKDNNSLLACLFHAVFLYGSDSYEGTDLFIEVNPRHRRFYEAMLGFKPIGELRMNGTVDAPSQLMWISVSEIASQIQRFRSGKSTCKHSLYSYFLSEAEEVRVKSRLALQGERGALSTLFEAC